MTRTQPSSKERNTTYATGADFCRIFKEDMQNLYLLSLMLAADPEKAERLFVSGLDDCTAGNPVFKEWARSWARRAIIKNAVRLTALGPEYANGAANTVVSSDAKNRVLPELPAEIVALLGLGSFERLAFILSVLEGYSDQDSALLLGCTRQALIAARVRAEQEIAGFVATQDGRPPDSGLKHQDSVIKLTFPARLATPA